MKLKTTNVDLFNLQGVSTGLISQLLSDINDDIDVLDSFRLKLLAITFGSYFHKNPEAVLWVCGYPHDPSEYENFTIDDMYNPKNPIYSVTRIDGSYIEKVYGNSPTLPLEHNHNYNLRDEFYKIYQSYEKYELLPSNEDWESKLKLEEFAPFEKDGGMSHAWEKISDGIHDVYSCGGLMYSKKDLDCLIGKIVGEDKVKDITLVVENMHLDEPLLKNYRETQALS